MPGKRFLFEKKFEKFKIIYYICDMEKKKRYMTVREYAGKTGYTVQRIYQLLKEGKLKGKKIGHFNFVLVE